MAADSVWAVQAAHALWPGPHGVAGLGLVVALAAGAVRGFAGFGFSALVVAALSPFVPPGPVVLATLLLEVVASLLLLRDVAPSVDRVWLRALVWGNVACIPVGLAALAWMPLTGLRALVAGALLAAALSLRGLDGHALRPGPALRTVAGVSSGLLNGLAASGGVVAALLMAATPLPPAALRATMITFLFWVCLYAVACAVGVSALGVSSQPLLGWSTLGWALLLAPAMVIGMRLGTRAFGHAQPQQYRRFVLNLLIGIAAAGLAAAWA